ncbi:MAG TPA: hypothetical protein VJN71_11525 [Nitrososphaerales archaeon]|nr:hypothetical protein [Nitrososphaerales archaeon]
MTSILNGIFFGAIAGFVSALCMTSFEVPLWKKWGMEGVAEWQVNSVMVSMIYFSRDHRSKKKTSPTYLTVAMHLFHGVILGIIFAFLETYVIGFGVLFFSVVSAVAYSMLLWIISPWATRKFFETRGGFQMSTKGLTVSLFSHIIYGVLLGLFLFQLLGH